MGFRRVCAGFGMLDMFEREAGAGRGEGGERGLSEYGYVIFLFNGWIGALRCE